jgi:hypothetical protein
MRMSDECRIFSTGEVALDAVPSPDARGRRHRSASGRTGLIAYECPTCGHVTSAVLPPEGPRLAFHDVKLLRRCAIATHSKMDSRFNSIEVIRTRRAAIA